MAEAGVPQRSGRGGWKGVVETQRCAKAVMYEPSSWPGKVGCCFVKFIRAFGNCPRETNFRALMAKLSGGNARGVAAAR